MTKITDELNTMARNKEQRMNGLKKKEKKRNEPAAKAIAAKLRGDLLISSQRARNLSQGKALLQTAEGGATQAYELLSKAKTLALSAASDTMDDEGRRAINQEVAAIVDQLDGSVKLDSRNLLGSSLSFETSSKSKINVSVDNLSATDLKVDKIDTSTKAGASSAISKIDDALKEVSGAIANIGASLSALDNARSNNDKSYEQLFNAKDTFDEKLSLEELLLKAQQISFVKGKRGQDD